jgi:hypothetical protein
MRKLLSKIISRFHKVIRHQYSYDEQSLWRVWGTRRT